jgi:hypothetical protein
MVWKNQCFEMLLFGHVFGHDYIGTTPGKKVNISSSLLPMNLTESGPYGVLE